jgi:uncharacterized protein YdaU (DUF1376 family)
MTDEELGCYMRLIIAQFNRGGKLPNDLKFLARYCDSLERSWPVVSEKFQPLPDGQIQNERMEIERVKSDEYSKSRKRNRDGGEDMNKHMSNHMTRHMGNGKGNGIYSKIKGVEFSTDLTEVIFPDNSRQKLGEGQLMDLKRGNLSAASIIKGSSPY